MAITIQDIAQCVGVSSSTVSRVLNRSGYVAASTRARIERAIEELQYQPSWAARSLRGKRTNLIGLIIPDIQNVFYTQIAQCILQNLNHSGYNLIIQISNEDPDLELSYLRTLYDRRVDGIIYVPAARGSNSVFIRELVGKGLPIVELNRQREVDLLDAVLADHHEGSYVATNHLIRLGHRRIAMLSGAPNLSTTRCQLSGYNRAFLESGLSPNPASIKASEFTREWGAQATEEILALDPRPTAVLAGNNRLLMGAMSAFVGQRVRVPEEMSVVSFDDSEWLGFWQPPITSVDVAIDEMGMLAVQLLVRRIEEGCRVEKPVTFRLSVKLVERQSCRRLS